MHHKDSQRNCYLTETGIYPNFSNVLPCRKNTTQQYVVKPLRHSQFSSLYARLQSFPKWWESVTDTLLYRRVFAVIILDRHLLYCTQSKRQNRLSTLHLIKLIKFQVVSLNIIDRCAPISIKWAQNNKNPSYYVIFLSSRIAYMP